jgi:SagB-type dehydrogenase family enzyme
MDRKVYVLLLAILICAGIAVFALLRRTNEGDISAPAHDAETIPMHNSETIKLPEPTVDGDVSLEQALLSRRSIREYRDQPLELEEVSQLLWAAQGVTDRSRGFRTAPSAGALYPLELYIVVGNVHGIPEGVYRYEPDAHELAKVGQRDVRDELSHAALEQSWVREGAAVVVFSAVYERTTSKYGQRGVRYVDMEVGHAAQNVCLQAAALDLGTVVVGAFQDDQVRQIMGMPDAEDPLYLMPVGRRRP